MNIYIGADHRGFELKEHLKKELSEFLFIDMGAPTLVASDDFVDYAVLVGQKVAADSSARGILICGSGAGMCIAANKLSGIRCSVCQSSDQVISATRDDDLNILTLASDFIMKDQAVETVRSFLKTEFRPEERFIRRIAKITELESHA